ncbi:MAG: flavin-containing monooxygenase [Acidimicrobiia bacterium]
MSSRSLRVAIIGAGPGGLCAGKRLLDEGFSEFTLLERAQDVGGTWNRNRYPGCECDVPSALYSFSFEHKCDWSKPYGTQPEILAYMRSIVDKYRLRPHCRFGDGVTHARWNDSTGTWAVTLESGDTVDADVVVSAIGMFNDLHWPDIEGLHAFGGAMWHSANWDWDHNLAGERVAVIGSAASAVQFVPEIVDTAGQVHLFQRSANWVLPKIDDPFTDTQLDAFRADPAPLLAFRAEVERQMNAGMTFSDPKVLAERESAGLAAIEIVREPEVRRKLRPTHPFGCKHPLFSNKYYPAFNEPNLELVTEPISTIHAGGIRTADGKERDVDTIVVATGFATTKYISAIDVTGRGGRSIHDAWNDGPLAYLGLTTSGFPNLFMLYGPNTEQRLDPDHARGPGGTYTRSPPAPRERQHRMGRRETRSGAPLQRRSARSHRRYPRLAGRLSRLLPLPERPDRHSMALLHGRVPATNGNARARRIRERPDNDRASRCVTNERPLKLRRWTSRR